MEDFKIKNLGCNFEVYYAVYVDVVDVDGEELEDYPIEEICGGIDEDGNCWDNFDRAKKFAINCAKNWNIIGEGTILNAIRIVEIANLMDTVDGDKIYSRGCWNMVRIAK